MSKRRTTKTEETKQRITEKFGTLTDHEKAVVFTALSEWLKSVERTAEKETTERR